MNGNTLRDMLLEAGVEVLDRGHGVAKGNFNIHCPLCGAADQGHHMGINIDKGWWGCWRNAEHRGKSPVRLMVAALGKPVWEVRRMLGIRDTPDPGAFDGLRARLLSSAAPPQETGANAPKQPSLVLPSDFHAFDPRRVTAAGRKFVEYVQGRGFTGSAFADVAHDYSLRYAFRGPFKDRVILPYTYRGAVVTWTGRSVFAAERLRYRDLEQAESVIFKNEVLFNYDAASMGGRALVVLEGPFDVVKGDYAGRVHGVRCVGLSTNNFSDAQLTQIAELSDAFEHVYIGMDTATSFDKMASYRMLAKMRGAVDARTVPGIETLGKDVGGASIRAVSTLFRSLANEPL
jgi:hypothetical protein